MAEAAYTKTRFEIARAVLREHKQFTPEEQDALAEAIAAAADAAAQVLRLENQFERDVIFQRIERIEKTLGIKFTEE